MGDFKIKMRAIIFIAIIIETNAILDNTYNEVIINNELENVKCDLCLIAVQKLEEMVEKNKTEESIKRALEKLCSKLPQALTGECQKFVDTYTDELVEMLIANLSPPEVCSYLKLCSDKTTAPASMKPLPLMLSGQIETKAILDNTYNGAIINNEEEKLEILDCLACEGVVWAMKKILGNSKVDHAMESVLEKTCKILPKSKRPKCISIIQKYGPKIFNLINQKVDEKKICRTIGLC